MAPSWSQMSPLASTPTRAFDTAGTRVKSKFSSVLPGGSFASARCRSKRRCSRSATSWLASAASRRAEGQPSRSARSVKPGPQRPHGGQAQLFEQEVDFGRVHDEGVAHASPPARQASSYNDIAGRATSTSGARPRLRREALAQEGGIGQLPGVEQLVDVGGELRFAALVVGQGEQRPTVRRQAWRSLRPSRSASKARRYASRGNRSSRQTQFSITIGLNRNDGSTCR